MTYPLSSDVSSGQPTAAAHYNNLRKDALYLGQALADSLSLGSYLSRHAANIKLVYLATNRIRVVYNGYHPAAVMVGGCMLKAAANIDLPANYFTGAASVFCIHAVRTVGSTTFTINANTTPVESDTSRVIGTCYWDGTNISNIISFYDSGGLPQADYDSGWFACTISTAYTKDHNLTAVPRMVLVYHSSDAAGTSEWVVVGVGANASNIATALVGVNATSVFVQSCTGSSNGTCYSTRRISAVGYYRILAWL